MSDYSEALMSGLASFAQNWGANRLDQRAAERKFKLQQDEAQLKQMADERRERISASLRAPSYNQVKRKGPDGRMIEETVRDAYDPNTQRIESVSQGSIDLPIDAPKTDTYTDENGNTVHREWDSAAGTWSKPVVGKKAVAARAPSELEQRLALAKQLGASPEEQKRIVMGSAAGEGRDKAPANFRYKDDGTLEPIPGGPADPANKASKGLPVDVKTKISLLDNAIRNAKEYKSRVVRPDGSFADIDSRLSNTPGLLKSAIQDSLYVKSGASAPDAEVRKWESIYGPSNVRLPLVGDTGIPAERDTTAAKKVDQLLADLESQRNVLLGGASMGEPETTAPDQAKSAGDSPANPVVVTGNEPSPPPPGTWMRLPDGRVVRAR